MLIRTGTYSRINMVIKYWEILTQGLVKEECSSDDHFSYLSIKTCVVDTH